MKHIWKTLYSFCKVALLLKEIVQLFPFNRWIDWSCLTTKSIMLMIPVDNKKYFTFLFVDFTIVSKYSWYIFRIQNHIALYRSAVRNTWGTITRPMCGPWANNRTQPNRLQARIQKISEVRCKNVGSFLAQNILQKGQVLPSRYVFICTSFVQWTSFFSLGFAHALIFVNAFMVTHQEGTATSHVPTDLARNWVVRITCSCMLARPLTQVEQPLHCRDALTWRRGLTILDKIA